jgi:hypothetical protein
MRRPFVTATTLVVAFAVQLAVWAFVLEHGLPEDSVKVLGIVLLPGVVLAWPQGAHSNSGLIGLPLAVGINTAYYFLILRACLGITRRLRSMSSNS